MGDSAPEKKDGDGFDVVVVGGATEDGGGNKVLRARPGRLEAGEIRPMREGRPLGDGEIVRLEPRDSSPAVFDVKVQCELPKSAAPKSAGPAQVATHAYRESWERVFGSGAPN